MIMNTTDAAAIAVVLSGLGEPTRMGILQQLGAGSSPVTALADKLGLPLVNVSHHLSVLFRAGLLTNERRGRQIVYRLNPEVFTPAGNPAGGLAGTVRAGRWQVHLNPPAGADS